MHYDNIIVTSDCEALQYADVTTAGSITGSNLTNVNWLSNLTVSGALFLNNNQLTNVDGLSNLTSVSGELFLNNNQLTNVDGLSNLTSIGNTLYLHNNQLTNIDGLCNLTNIGYHFNLSNNQLTNVDGLSNLIWAGGFSGVTADVIFSNNQLINISGLTKGFAGSHRGYPIWDNAFDVDIDYTAFGCYPSYLDYYGSARLNLTRDGLARAYPTLIADYMAAYPNGNPACEDLDSDCCYSDERLEAIMVTNIGQALTEVF